MIEDFLTKKLCIRVNVRGLDRVPKYNVSYLYILGYWSILH